MPKRAPAWSTWCLLLIAGSARAAPPAELPDGIFSELELRHVGPVGNRVVAVTGVPGDPNVYFAGAASGGIFESTDGGVHWEPIFDDQPAASIGAFAVAPSDPNVIWAGTGETFLRANVSIGNGVYRSTDGGESWSHLGLDRTGRISRLVVHPDDPDTAWVAALGSCYGPQEERGVYRTTDGGQSWQRVLFVDENTGASDLVMDPNNPRILFAGMWQIELNGWSRRSGGPGSSLWTSRDGGDSWTKLEGHGLPDPPWGKIGLAMSADDSRRVYALIETSSNRDFEPVDEFQGVLWRSDDGGESWEVVSRDNTLVQRPLYYTRAVAAPDDADEVYFMAVEHTRSLDGGRSVEELDTGWDHHDMWIDPEIPDRMIVGHDGGVSITTNRGASWMRPLLPNAQMYHVATDREVPYHLYGNRQDGSSTRGPSRTLSGSDEIPIGEWSSVGGCEVGFTLPSPAGDVVWTGCYDGMLDLYDLASGVSRNVMVWPAHVESWPAEDLRYRFQWSFPLAISPHDPRRVYAGSQYLHRTTDGGQSWEVTSPDLTTDAPELQRRTGGLTLDDAAPTLAPTLFAIAESPLEEGLIWVGTNDGQVQVTRDGGQHWKNVTRSLPGLGPWGVVSNVEPSPHEAGTCYLTIDRHQENDPAPYVYVTRDYGEHWTRIDDTLPRTPFGYAHCVREDPERPGLLYLGTENALYLSFDAGRRWRKLDSNLPPAPVSWITVQPDFGDLVVATYGRGFWILDDLTPLRELQAEDLERDAILFPPRPAWRFRQRGAPFSHEDPAEGTNPPYGANLDFYLRTEPEDDVQITVLDGEGLTVRTLDEVPKEAGLHRVWWDLHYDETEQPRLRTPPQEHPFIGVGDEGWRELSDGGRFALLAPPGTYQVRLSAGDTVVTRELEVRRDPHAPGSDQDLEAQMGVLFGLRELIDRSARMINELEWLRKQLRDLRDRLTDLPADPAVDEAAEALAARLEGVESRFFDLRLTGASQDSLRWKRLLYDQLTFLAQVIGQSDERPTNSQAARYRELEAEVAGLREQYDLLLSDDIAAFNTLLTEKGLAGLIAGS